MQNPGADFEPQKREVSLHKDVNLYVLFLVSLTLLFGITSISPAFPKIASTFNIPASQVGLLISVYVLPALVLDPVLGVIADRTQRKWIVAASLVVFGLACMACAFAQSFQALLWFRFLQGVGAAGLRSLPLAIVGSLYSAVRLRTAMGYIASVSGLGSIVFTSLGGVLADRGWQYPFILGLFSLPVALLVCFALNIPKPEATVSFRRHTQSALACLNNYQRITLFITSALLGAINFGIYQLYLPLLMADKFQSSGSMIGAALAIGAIAFILGSTLIRRFATWLSDVAIIQAGFCLCAIALLVIPIVSELRVILLPVFLFSFGVGLVLPSLRSLLASLAPRDYLATTMAVNGTFFGIGQFLGPVLLGNIVDTAGLSSAFYIGAGLAMTTMLLLERSLRVRSNAV